MPLNPFSRAFGREPCSATREPAEGGILMLHDIQESQASRAALVSAWRDYGPKESPRLSNLAEPPITDMSPPLPVWCAVHA